MKSRSSKHSEDVSKPTSFVMHCEDDVNMAPQMLGLVLICSLVGALGFLFALLTGSGFWLAVMVFIVGGAFAIILGGLLVAISRSVRK